MAELTSGVNKYTIPLVEPFNVRPLIRNIVRTTYGSVDVT